MMRTAKIGSILLILTSLLFLGSYLAARVYSSYVTNGMGPELVYQTIVAIVLISPIVSILMILMILTRPGRRLHNARPAADIGLTGIAFLWVFTALPFSIALGL